MMKTMCNILAAAFTGLILGMPAQAEPPSVDILLEQANPAETLDTLDADDRAGAVMLLVQALGKAEGDRKRAIADALCHMGPWSTSDDAGVQRAIWAEMVDITDPQSDLSYALDCAAANREGFYRAATITPLFDMRLSYCAGQPLGDDVVAVLDAIETEIMRFSREMTDGLASAFKEAGADQTFSSYFPLRTAFRLATVRAARAVEYARLGDWSKAQAGFREAADALPDLPVADYPKIWGAWRFHNDLIFYRSFYSWLAGADDLGMQSLLIWPTIAADKSLWKGIAPDILKRIRAYDDARPSGDAYVDWIYVERLLPGASTPTEECGGWRRRYYNTHELVAKLVECADHSGRPSDYAGLWALDRCILEYQADDWSIQFMTVYDEYRKDAETVIAEFVARIVATQSFSGLAPADRAKAAALLGSSKPLQDMTRANLYRFVTDEGLTTEMRSAIEAAIEVDKVPLPWGTAPLFRRPTYF